jgi:hypothetical protein
MDFGEILHDREAEPEAAVRARAGGIRLAEAIEHVREKLGRDPLPCVGHADGDV